MQSIVDKSYQLVIIVFFNCCTLLMFAEIKWNNIKPLEKVWSNSRFQIINDPLDYTFYVQVSRALFLLRRLK